MAAGHRKAGEARAGSWSERQPAPPITTTAPGAGLAARGPQLSPREVISPHAPPPRASLALIRARAPPPSRVQGGARGLRNRAIRTMARVRGRADEAELRGAFSEYDAISHVRVKEKTALVLFESEDRSRSRSRATRAVVDRGI